MKKRHVYDLVILLAAGTIMMSACGKKPRMRLLIQQRPHRPKDQTEASDRGNHQTRRNSIRNTGPEDTESTKFYMPQGTGYKKQKKTALPLPYWPMTEMNIPSLFLISAMWKQRLKRISRLPLPV